MFGKTRYISTYRTRRWRELKVNISYIIGYPVGRFTFSDFQAQNTFQFSTDITIHAINFKYFITKLNNTVKVNAHIVQ